MLTSKSVKIKLSDYLISLRSKEKKVEGNCSNEVDQKPTFEIVDRNLARMYYKLARKHKSIT